MIEIRCSGSGHQGLRNAKGWSDGVLATISGAKEVPSYLCAACASAAEVVASAPPPSDLEQLKERVEALEASVQELRK